MKKILVYHGSNMPIPAPELRIKPNRTMDFGYGFYTTTNYNQAIRFTNAVIKRNQGEGVPTISIYELDLEILENMKFLQFDKPDKEWLNFVTANRMNEYKGEEYDVVYGPVANDTIYTVIPAYFAGQLSEEDTLSFLKIRKLENQFVFKTEEAIELLHFVNAEVVSNA